MASLVTAGGLVAGGATTAHAADPGQFDTTFATNTAGGLADSGYSVAAQADGKIVVTGAFTNAGGATATRIARFNSDGTPDTTFNTAIATNGGLDDTGLSVAEQADGKIVVTGAFTNAGGGTANRIARFNADGTVDTDFITNTNGGLGNWGWSTAEQSDGKLAVVGGFTTAGAAAATRIARFNSDGTPDTTFNTTIAANGGLDSTGRSVAEQTDGKILVTGSFLNAGGAAATRIARFNSDGTPDTTFNTTIAANGGLDDTGWSTAQQSDGKILVTGDFLNAGGEAANHIARFNSDGTPDTTFNTNTSGGLSAYGSSIAELADGYVVVTGQFTTAGGEAANHIARFNSDGTPDTAFNTNTSGGLSAYGSSVVEQAPGVIVVTGQFITGGGTTANRIARLYGTGTALTPTFGTPTSTADGFTVQVSNYDAAYTWGATATSGAVAISGTGLVTVTGLAPQASSTVTVTTNRTSYTGGTSNVTGTASAKIKQRPVSHCAITPKKLNSTGHKKLAKKGCITNAGQRVAVKVTAKKYGATAAYQEPLGHKKGYSLYCKASGKKEKRTSSAGYGKGFRYCKTHKRRLMIRTYGQWKKITITWRAPATTTHTKFKRTHKYRRFRH
ncbi:MAG: hypothetical protein U0990_10270 [Candidatus Nanopelagicales bacterium]|nr:hypothetical protein [Candidatus Nanopelagicales bacterium]MDZ4250459.1 hypothetical protein [Candidatus Nanopelagicales bacterium]